MSDFLQEWGRLTFREKGLFSLGIRILDLKDRTLRLICPLVKPGKENFYYPDRQSQRIEWYSYKSQELIEGTDITINGREEWKIGYGFWKKTQQTIENLVKKYIEFKENLDQGKNEEIKKTIEKALLLNYIVKFREFIFKFHYSDKNLLGLFNFNSNFFQIEWTGLSTNFNKYDPYKYPP